MVDMMKSILTPIIALLLLAGVVVAASPAGAHNSISHCGFEAKYGQTVNYGSGLHRLNMTGGNHVDCTWIGYVYCTITFWGSTDYTTRSTPWYTKKTSGTTSWRSSYCPYGWRAYWVQTTGYVTYHG